MRRQAAFGGMMVARTILVFLYLACFSAQLGAEQNVNPEINRHYENPDVTQWRGVFEREGREIWDRRADIIYQLGLNSGQKVADIGAGTGFFTVMMAREVGATGQVYAVDIARQFVDASVQRAREQGLENVVGVVNDQQSTQLPADQIDLVFISDTYHHFEYPQAMLRSIHGALKTGGELVIIDFRRIPEQSSSWVVEHVRAGKQQVIAEIEAADFELTQSLDLMQTQYYLRFRKK